jgi:hypothetical protein
MSAPITRNTKVLDLDWGPRLIKYSVFSVFVDALFYRPEGGAYRAECLLKDTTVGHILDLRVDWLRACGIGKETLVAIDRVLARVEPDQDPIAWIGA